MAEELNPTMSPKPVMDKPIITCNFSECLKLLLEDKSCRRLDWKDKRIHISIRDSQLMIWKVEDSRYHPLILSVGDIEGRDWVVAEKSEVVN